MALSDSGALSIRAIVPSRPVANRCGIGVNFKRLESRSFEVSAVALEIVNFTGMPSGIPHNVCFSKGSKELGEYPAVRLVVALN
jgi:hypothetical protein